MIVKELLSPDSIVIIGASNDVEKPGGKILKNIIDGGYTGALYGVNPKESSVQGIDCFKSVVELPQVELAVLAIAAKFIPETVEILTTQKNTKAFIILSAGFSEVGPEGKLIEDKVVELIDKAGGSLIGPNCIGVLTPRYNGTFAGPLPKLEPKGVDFVSGSGATAVFILETAIPMGIPFASLFSVGNSAQIGVEDVLRHWDENFTEGESSEVKIIYIEQIAKPELFLKHCRSLISKGCRIAAIKSGTTDAGSRAVSSHTGALAGSDAAVDALFAKAGIIRCYGREELAYVAGALLHKQLPGKRLAVITHAGGPGVMLTDILAKGGLQVPGISGEAASELLEKLFHGSSVANPIDFLATGTAGQLGTILDYVDDKFDNIDGSVVIYGTPGLFDVAPTYTVLDEKMKTCKKPIYPVLPSIIQAKEATDYFISLGRIAFKDEVLLGSALTKISDALEKHKDIDKNVSEFSEAIEIDNTLIRKVINENPDGYLSPAAVAALLDSVKIPRAKEAQTKSLDDGIASLEKIGFPVVMKVIGPVHKTDVGGVKLGIDNQSSFTDAYNELMKIDGAEGVLIQEMLPKGLELFIGAKREPDFGHLILCGLGGVFIEVFKDTACSLAPVSLQEAKMMIKSLKSYPLIKGIRGSKGIDESAFAEAIVRLSGLLAEAPEIDELDINPFLGYETGITAVDCRIKLSK